jgi:hypothetical protein
MDDCFCSKGKGIVTKCHGRAMFRCGDGRRVVSRQKLQTFCSLSILV